MGNFIKKQQRRLDQRIAGFEAIPINRRAGFKRPGSQNAHKQGSGTGGKGTVGRR